MVVVGKREKKGTEEKSFVVLLLDGQTLLIFFVHPKSQTASFLKNTENKHNDTTVCLLVL